MMSRMKDMLRVALPVGTVRGRISRELACKVGLIQSSLSSGPFSVYVRQVERTIFVAPVSWTRSTPLISIVVPFFNTPDRFLRPLLDCLAGQSFPGWELVMADASTRVKRIGTIQAAAAEDPRFRYVRLDENAGISENTNTALAHARGTYVAFVDHDDLLNLNALSEVAARLLARPEIDICYSDEDVIDEAGRYRHTPFFKPAWSPHMFLQCNYTNHLSVIRRSLVEEVGGLRSELDGAQDYDLLLRLHTLGRPLVVAHIPKILYHWRQAPSSTASSMESKPYAVKAGQRALREYLGRVGVACAGVTPEKNRPGWYHVRPRWACQVAVIVAFSATRTLNEQLIGQLQAVTRCRYVSPVFVAYDGDVDDALARARDAEAVVVVGSPALPDDASWLDELVGALALPQTGVVAPIVYDDGGGAKRALDAGWVAADADAVLQPLYPGEIVEGGGIAGPTDMVRDVDGVSAVIVAVRRAEAASVLRMASGVSPTASGSRVIRPTSGYAVLWGHQRVRRLRWPLYDGSVNGDLVLESGRPTLEGLEAA
jgi:hypothetical protein